MTERETRVKFWEAARRAFPDTAEPGVVWVLTEVLGYDWERVKRISVDGFSRQGYRFFMIHEDGTREYDQDGNTLAVFRPWTPQEKSKLKDWWWLIGY